MKHLSTCTDRIMMLLKEGPGAQSHWAEGALTQSDVCINGQRATPHQAERLRAQERQCRATRGKAVWQRFRNLWRAGGSQQWLAPTCPFSSQESPSFLSDIAAKCLGFSGSGRCALAAPLSRPDVRTRRGIQGFLCLVVL